MRATISVALPGVKGTMTLIGFAGQACADAALASAHIAIAARILESRFIARSRVWNRRMVS